MMTDLPYLDYYSGQSTNELLNQEGKYFTASIVSAFNDALLQKMEKIGFAKLTEEERVVLAVTNLDAAAANGGFGMFFENSIVFVPIVVDSLNRVGCTRAASLTQEAIDILKDKWPHILNKSDDLIDSEEFDDLQDDLLDCDEHYFEEIEDPSDQIMAYIKKNNNKITIP